MFHENLFARKLSKIHSSRYGDRHFCIPNNGSAELDQTEKLSAGQKYLINKKIMINSFHMVDI